MEPIYITLILLFLIVIPTEIQTKALMAYLKAKDAISEDKAIEIPADVKRKYMLAVPIISSLVIKKEGDKYWVDENSWWFKWGMKWTRMIGLIFGVIVFILAIYLYVQFYSV